MVLKKGSKGEQVKQLQEFLGLKADGIFGPGTERAVKDFQKANGIRFDGIVGPQTWDLMGLATTDTSESIYVTENDLTIERHYLPKGEYKEGPTDKQGI